MQQQLAGTTISLTEAEHRQFEERQRKTEVLLLRMADSTPEESDRLAGRFFYEIRAARRVQSARGVRQQQVAAIVRPRARERRPAETRRAASSSSTSSSDPGPADADLEAARLWPDPPKELVEDGGTVRTNDPLSDELSRLAERLRARGGLG